MNITLTTGINDEQLLDFALEYLNMFGSDDEHNDVADKILVNRALQELKPPFTDKDVQQYCAELIFEYAMASLVAKGYAEVDLGGDKPSYTLAEDIYDD